MSSVSATAMGSIGEAATLTASNMLTAWLCTVLLRTENASSSTWAAGSKAYSMQESTCLSLVMLALMACVFQGQGTYFYSRDGQERYEGEWSQGERSGWGRMAYADGSIYEGEWLNDARSGLGLLLQGK